MKTKIWLFALLALFLNAQTIESTLQTYEFSGIVLDQDSQEGLIGANVVIDGTRIGTTTDIDGRFTIQYKKKKAKLTINSIGYETQTIEAVAGKKIKVKMNAAAMLCEEVVVTEYSDRSVRLSQAQRADRKIRYKKDRSQRKAERVAKKRMAKEKKHRMPSTSIGIANKPKIVAPPVLSRPITTPNPIASTPTPPAVMAPPANAIKNVTPITLNPPMPIAADDAKTIGGTKINTGGESYDLINENQFFLAKQEPLSTFSIDVDAASYSNMRRFVQQGQQPPVDAIRIEEMVNYFNYDYPQPKTTHPFEIITEIAPCPWKPENRLFHIGLQGKKIATKDLPASNLVFLIDVSGSMGSANKLPLLQSSLNLLISQLRPKDRVAIVVYAGAAGLVLPSTAGSNPTAIRNALNKLRSGGSTAGGAGIKLAYKVARENFVQDGNNRIILATDGDFNVGASSNADMVRLIEKERESGVFLTVLGFGMGNYQDSKMQQLADKGNGNHAYIDKLDEAKKVLINEFGGTMFTIAKDVKLQLEFNPAKVKGYRLIGYENRILAHEDFNDDKKDAGELGAGHTVTAIYEIIPTNVESNYLKDIDPLKYQTTGKSTGSDEMVTVKFRYKKPDGFKSRLIQQVVKDGSSSKPSINFNWSASVAEFGLLLRKSAFKGQANYADAIRRAEAAKGKDANGYRAEMIGLMKKMKSVAEPELAGK